MLESNSDNPISHNPLNLAQFNTMHKLEGGEGAQKYLTSRPRQISNNLPDRNAVFVLPAREQLKQINV